MELRYNKSILSCKKNGVIWLLDEIWKIGYYILNKRSALAGEYPVSADFFV